VSSSFVTGVIPRAKMQTFERILWRALRGNLYLNYAEIDEPIIDPITDEELEKNVFIIFAHGRELLNKIRKISESLDATLYPLDANSDKRRENLEEITARIDDLQSVLKNTDEARRAELQKIAENLATWITIIKKEKAVYHTMNLFNFDANRKCLIAEGWCPSQELNQIHRALRIAMVHMQSFIHSFILHILFALIITCPFRKGRVLWYHRSLTKSAPQKNRQHSIVSISSQVASKRS
jgi:V-type H+-transporting ATPase subunit a